MKPVTCQGFFLIFVAISKKYENVLCSSTKLVTLLILLLIHKLLCAIMKIGQYRTKIVRQMRRQIFRQMKQKAE